MAYIHFTDSQKEQARQTDIAAMLMSRGETVKKSGSEFEWLDGGAKVTIRGNLWYHQYEQKGGDAIEFVKRFMDKTYPEAVEFLLGGSVGTIVCELSGDVEVKVFVNGTETAYELGDTLTKVGQYKVTVTDKCGNITEYTFRIEKGISGGIIALIVIGSVLLLGGVATVVILKKKNIF